MNRYVLIREKESEKFIICYPRTIIPGYKFNSPEQDFDICWQYAVDAGLVEYGARLKYRFEFIIPDNLFNKNIAK